MRTLIHQVTTSLNSVKFEKWEPPTASVSMKQVFSVTWETLSQLALLWKHYANPGSIACRRENLSVTNICFSVRCIQTCAIFLVCRHSLNCVPLYANNEFTESLQQHIAGVISFVWSTSRKHSVLRVFFRPERSQHNQPQLAEINKLTSIDSLMIYFRYYNITILYINNMYKMMCSCRGYTDTILNLQQSSASHTLFNLQLMMLKYGPL